MKFLGIAILAQIVLFAAFAVGLTSQLAPLMIGAFCLWTPAAWLLGFAFARSNLRVSVGVGQAPIQQPTAYIPPVTPRQPAPSNGSLLNRTMQKEPGK